MNDWCPGAVQVPQPGGVTLDRTLPPRVVWHITDDALDANGHQPEMGAVDNYLVGKEWCPHITWNPFTGEMVQFYPASVGSRALMYNDQDGAVCVQVEIFFTPGCVVNGVKYNTVADTPLVGFDTLLAWADSLGVPRVWPMGAPQWQGNARDVAIWNGNAGHYGHCNSPGDTHTDPGPMPSLNRITPKEGFLMALTDQQQADLYWQLCTPDGRAALGGYVLAAIDGKVKQNAVQAESVAARAAALAAPAVLSQTFALSDGTKTNLAGLLDQLHARPAATVVTNAAPVALDVDALVARLKTELPPAVLSELASKITNP